LADRRVDRPALAEFGLQTVERVEHAAVRADVLTGNEHGRVGRHFELDRLGECGDVRDRAIAGHDWAPVKTPASNWSSSGNGLSSANTTAASISARTFAQLSSSSSRDASLLSISRASNVKIGSRSFHASTSSSGRYLSPRFWMPWWL